MAKAKSTSVTFDRNAIAKAMTTSVVSAMQGYDKAASAYNLSTGERNAMLLASMVAARTACAGDTGAYLAIVDEVYGNGVNGKAKDYVAGTAREALEAAKCTNLNSLKTTLSETRLVARWFADPTHSFADKDGKALALNTLIGIARGKRDSNGKPLKGPTSAVTPASIKAQIKLWYKAGYGFDIADSFAAVLKESKDNVILAISTDLVDVAADLKVATTAK
jgi:hypothetical protein